MLRRPLRFLALFALCAYFLPQALVSRLPALLGAHARGLRWAAATQRRWARAFVAVMGIELELEGALPAGPCLIVSNHLSYLDIPVLAAFFPGRFVAKSEIASWPLLGQLASAVGTIFVVQRKARDVVRVEREMSTTLAAGVPVLLFPEGRSTRGARVERWHSSLIESAVRGSFPCLAVALSYETPVDPWAPAATVCWWGGMGFWSHAWTLVGLRRVRARVSVAETVRTGTERKALTERLRQDLLARFHPVRQQPVPPGEDWERLFSEGPAETMVPSAVRE